MVEPWATAAVGLWLIVAIPLGLILSDDDPLALPGDVPRTQWLGFITGLAWPLFPMSALVLVALVAALWLPMKAIEIWNKPWGGEHD